MGTQILRGVATLKIDIIAITKLSYNVKEHAKPLAFAPSLPVDMIPRIPISDRGLHRASLSSPIRLDTVNTVPILPNKHDRRITKQPCGSMAQESFKSYKVIQGLL